MASLQQLPWYQAQNIEAEASGRADAFLASFVLYSRTEQRLALFQNKEQLSFA